LHRSIRSRRLAADRRNRRLLPALILQPVWRHRQFGAIVLPYKTGGGTSRNHAHNFGKPLLGHMPAPSVPHTIILQISFVNSTGSSTGKPSISSA
jgi:hypothetical protein